jgi:site-specific DNA recombinase
MDVLKQKLEIITGQQDDLKKSLKKAQGEDKKELARRIKNVLDTYKSSDASGRNLLLKSVIEKIEYNKKKKTAPDDFELIIKLRSF